MDLRMGFGHRHPNAAADTGLAAIVMNRTVEGRILAWVTSVLGHDRQKQTQAHCTCGTGEI